MIGANAVVTKSFEKGNCCIAGTPARIISFEPNIYQYGKYEVVKCVEIYYVSQNC